VGPGGSKVVLVVDDSEMIIQVVRTVVEQMGYVVVTAANGAAALVTAQTLPPDLIFLDLHMPEMSGLEMLREMRLDRSLEQTPVVLLTSSRSPDVMTKAARLGVRDYISKPARPARIREKVAKYLE
jgi:CheY-like chemotaxis protein